MSDPLPNVLKKLTNEVMGLLGAYEPGLRELIGHTNYNCLKMRAEAGRDALKREPSELTAEPAQETQ